MKKEGFSTEIKSKNEYHNRYSDEVGFYNTLITEAEENKLSQMNYSKKFITEQDPDFLKWLADEKVSLINLKKIIKELDKEDVDIHENFNEEIIQSIKSGYIRHQTAVGEARHKNVENLQKYQKVKSEFKQYLSTDSNKAEYTKRFINWIIDKSFDLKDFQEYEKFLKGKVSFDSTQGIGSAQWFQITGDLYSEYREYKEDQKVIVEEAIEKQQVLRKENETLKSWEYADDFIDVTRKGNPEFLQWILDEKITQDDLLGLIGYAQMKNPYVNNIDRTLAHKGYTRESLGQIVLLKNLYREYKQVLRAESTEGWPEDLGYATDIGNVPAGSEWDFENPIILEEGEQEQDAVLGSESQIKEKRIPRKQKKKMEKMKTIVQSNTHLNKNKEVNRKVEHDNTNAEQKQELSFIKPDVLEGAPNKIEKTEGFLTKVPFLAKAAAAVFGITATAYVLSKPPHSNSSSLNAQNPLEYSLKNKKTTKGTPENTLGFSSGAFSSVKPTEKYTGLVNTDDFSVRGLEKPQIVTTVENSGKLPTTEKPKGFLRNLGQILSQVFLRKKIPEIKVSGIGDYQLKAGISGDVRNEPSLPARLDTEGIKSSPLEGALEADVATENALDQLAKTYENNSPVAPVPRDKRNVTKQEQKEYTLYSWKVLRALEKEYKFPSKVVVSQLRQESGYGGSELAAKYNNHLGLTCGHRAESHTDHCARIGKQYFMKFDSFEDCIREYGKRMNTRRYKNVFSDNMTVSGFAKKLREAGYIEGDQAAEYPNALNNHWRAIQGYSLDRKKKRGWNRKNKKVEENSLGDGAVGSGF